MMHPMDMPPTSGLMKPMYVIQMGWHRMHARSRKKWATELGLACLDVAVKTGVLRPQPIGKDGEHYDPAHVYVLAEEHR